VNSELFCGICAREQEESCKNRVKKMIDRILDAALEVKQIEGKQQMDKTRNMGVISKY
jgi:hypothetical protein